MKRLLREFYGVGILFLYYMKFPLLLGWPLLRFGLEYKDNFIMNLLWVIALGALLKDGVSRFILKEKPCQEASLHHMTQSSEKKLKP